MSHHSTEPPFTLEHQLVRDEPTRGVPGYPLIPLDNESKVWTFLASEFCSGDLDRMAPRLWWMSKQDGRNISPLHRQLVKRRSITVTEDPKLHLAWIYDRIFIKPLPRYLCSYAFWKRYLCQDNGDRDCRTKIRRAALGYLRTYSRLIRYESDLRIAKDPSLCLVPADVTWEEFCDFTTSLGEITDDAVSLRYNYGEIRLTRLNFYAPVILGRSHYQRVEYQYGSYFARFYGPVLFVIGVESVALSGMQVAVSIGGDGGTFWTRVALWVSSLAIVTSYGLIVSFGLLLTYKVAKEWIYALKDRRRIRNGSASAKSSSMKQPDTGRRNLCSV